MKLLLFDTCGQDGSIALADTTAPETVVEMGWLPGRTSSERLVPELRRMMRAHAWTLKELEAVAVLSGPGSFTGVRVGLTAAKGLCEAADLPLVAVSRLAVLANKGAGSSIRAHAVLDAGRGEFFYGRYGPAEPPLEALLTREAVLAAARDGGMVVVCEENVRASLAELLPLATGTLEVTDALPLVIARVERGEFSDIAGSDANYLRRTETEVLARLAQRGSGA